MNTGQSFFNSNRSCTCGSTDIAHFAEWLSGEIPIGIAGVRACRSCVRWEQVLTIAPAKNIWDMPNWAILRQGQGEYSSWEEAQAKTTWLNPDGDSFPRFDFKAARKD